MQRGVMGGQRWEVVGGADKGGILVRGGQSTTSEQLGDRLATGAVVEELELVGERLRYQKISGAGPDAGWVSTSLKDKELLVKVAAAAPAAPAAEADKAAENPATTPAPAGSDGDGWSLREGDYYVTLGLVFKKPGTDPGTEKILKLNRKVGAVVHTTGKTWKSPKGGIWVELDTSAGDTGAGEKPGYVMIDASGFGTPGPCLQKANTEDGPPILLRAATPAEGKPWDGSAAAEKEFLVLQKTTMEEVRIVIGMLFGLSTSLVSIAADASATDATTVQEAGYQGGAEVKFQVAKAAKALNLVVMSPLEEGVKLLDLAMQDDWTVGQAKALLCSTTGLKKSSTMMAKGKMGTRTTEDAALPDSKKVVECGYKEGDEIAFIYLGDPTADLEGFLAKK